ncbi:unnamed protein product [Pedinophyceae sp. YPF-701]|nr:unnamed protein product [Pedinophyceae sp. YPF-701]
MVDAHADGHRVAFNEAFRSMKGELGGHPEWDPKTYSDLRKHADGTPLGMLYVSFETFGWPTTVGEDKYAREAFILEIHQRKVSILEDLVVKGKIPLRDGAHALVSSAVAAGAKVALVTHTASAPNEGFTDLVLGHLGPELAASVLVCPVDNSPGGVSSDSDSEPATGDKLQKAVQRAAKDARMEAAYSAARVLKGVTVGAGVGASSQPGLTASWLTAVSTLMGVPPRNCTYLGATTPGIAAAAGCGMLAAAVPAKFDGGAQYDGADLKFMGLGPGGGATWTKVEALLAARAAKEQQ